MPKSNNSWMFNNSINNHISIKILHCPLWNQIVMFWFVWFDIIFVFFFCFYFYFYIFFIQWQEFIELTLEQKKRKINANWFWHFGCTKTITKSHHLILYMFHNHTINDLDDFCFVGGIYRVFSGVIAFCWWVALFWLLL